eukprot:scaffold302848_cov35-Tisochrysis_lutea.AAC.1
MCFSSQATHLPSGRPQDWGSSYNAAVPTARARGWPTQRQRHVAAAHRVGSRLFLFPIFYDGVPTTKGFRQQEERRRRRRQQHLS